MRVLAVSDVAVGYGTPQLPLLALSLVEHYQAEGFLVEPAQPEAPPRHHLFPQLSIRRVSSMFHPHSERGRQEYVWRAAQIVNRLRPDVLVICCTFCLPVLFKLRYRPRTVIYYAVESISFYGEFDIEMNRWTDGLVDLVLFPEENRAAAEVRRFGFHTAQKVIVYNATKRAAAIGAPLAAAERNGRWLCSGTLDPEQTLARYFLSEQINQPLDLFGPLKLPSQHERQSFVQILTQTGMKRYQGYVPADELARLRPSYLYSIVMWNPSNENQLFAAPNKFFESIGDGVPPIAAPHPQCKLLIERYGCGLLMEGWSFEAFRSAMAQARQLAGKPAWERLVDNCRRAATAELNWDAQFAKVRKFLN